MSTKPFSFEEAQKPVDAAAAPTQPEPFSFEAATGEAPKRGFGGWARDVGATAVKGAIAVPEMVVGLADIPTGGRVGKFLENEGGAVGFRPKEAKELVNDWHSDATKEAQRKFQEADGFWDKAATAVQNPSLIATAVGESIPSMLAGGVMGRGALAAARGLGFAATPAATAAGAALATKQATIAGAAGEGLAMAGSAAEQIRQETEDGLLTPMQSGAALLTGAAGGVISRLSGGLQNKLGIGDADTMAVQGLGRAASPGAAAGVNPLVQQAAARSIPNQVVLGAINEGLLEELPQSLAEQMLQNVALGKPWHQDLDAAAIMGTLSGGVMGAGAAGLNAYRNSGAPAQADPNNPGQPGQPDAEAAPQPSPGMQAMRAEYEARLADLQAQEQGEAPVRQTTPESVRKVIEDRRAAEMAAGRAVAGPDDEIYQSTGATDPVRQMVKQAADAGGALSSAAVVAIDTGAAGQMQQAADQAQAQAVAQEQAKAGKKADPAAKVDASTGEIAGGAMASWSDDQLSSAFRGAQDRKVRIQIANELQRRRTEREQADLQAELQDEQAAMAMPDLPDNAFASVSEDAGEAPADLFIDEPATRSPAPRKGNSNGTQATQAQQAEPKQPAQPANPPAAGPAFAGSDRQGEAVGQPVPQPGALTNAAPTPNNGAQAATAPGPQTQAGGEATSPAAATEALRTQLREVEDKILRAAPGAMAAGGGDAEAAMKSPKVPVTLKVQRKKLKDQINSAPAGDTKQFAPETGTLGIPRADMPQVPTQSHGGLVKHLNAQGIAHETTTIDAASLKPTQAEYSPEKVEAAKSAQGDRAVIVSSDGHIIDGHHQAVAAAEQGKTVKAIVLDAPVEQALEAVKNSPSASQPAPQETAAQPAPKKPSRSVLAKLKEQARAEHFAPGNVIASYGGGHDRVVSYQPSDEQGNWSVTVRAVQKQGDTWVDVPNERDRTHSTQPDAKELTRGPVGKVAAPAPSEIDHNGTRIYQTKIRLADTEPKLMWAVESATNKVKRMAGERTVAGDTLHDSLDQAKAAADREAQRDAEESAYKAELEAQDKARQAAEEARKAENRGKSVVERHKDAVLSKQIRDSERGDVVTRREWVERKVEQGLEPKITQEDKIKPMSRMQSHRASNAEQAAHERKIKQAGKKDVFWLGDFEVTKTEHDYAQSLKAMAKPAADAADEPAAGTKTASAEEAPKMGQPEVGPFGPVLTQYRGDAQGAIKALSELQDGEAVAALSHPDVGDIDLVWGAAPEGKREGFGLAKIMMKHPEVLADLQGFISSLSKDVGRSGANRVRLVDSSGEAVVSLDWKGDRKVWLLTAYEKGAEAGTTMDTASSSSEGDTARPGPDALQSLPITPGDRKDEGSHEKVVGGDTRTDTAANAAEGDTARLSAGKESVPTSTGDNKGSNEQADARFERLRAKGGQNAGINAFAKIAGATGEAVTDVWQRWRSVMAFDDKVEKGAGADVAKAMQEQLLKAPWANDAVYPGDGRSMSPAATLHQWRVREGKFAEQKESFSRELDREELRARDAENFGVPVEAVSQAREAVAAMRKRVIELEAEVKDGVAEAEAREEAAKTAEQKAYQDSFEMPSQSVLAKKPTPASIDNWSNPVEWRGKTAYTNGHFVDVTGTPPHLKDWESRKGVRQNLTTSVTDRVLGMAGVRDGFPDSSHVKADPLAVIDDAKSGRLFFDVQGELVSIDLKYARYFHSKVKGVTFTANPKDLGAPLRVMDGDNLVGIVMPFRPTIYDKSSKMTVADVRGYMASSGKDKPQSVVKRAQQAKEQEAKPAETPAEDAADVFPMQEAASSYSGISHSGTQRAKSDAAEFEAYIERANAAGLALAETDEQKAAVEQATKSLRADYLAAYRRMMGVRAGTYSGFVAGRSGLNAKQADRSNSAYDRAIDAFVSWQKENDNRVRRAALDARTDEAKQADIDAARAADDQKAQAKEDADLTLMRKILNWKKGGEPVAIGKAANLNGVNLDKAGYPSSVKLSPTDGSTLSDDKFDLAALFRRKGMSVPDSKRRVRELVDAVRAEDGAQVAAAKAEPAAKTEDSKTPTVDRHMEVMEGVRAGTATPEQFKASFNAVVDGKQAILAELNTKTKAELQNDYGAWMRYSGDTKADLVTRAYGQIVGQYALGESVSYGMTNGSYEAAVRKMVEATDEAKLQSYMEERKEAVKEAMARMAAREQAIADPKTMADFREVLRAKIRDGMTLQEAFLTLTPEQRIKYDTLAAESTRERREEIKRKAKTQLATAGNTSASEVIATKHTKLGHDLFVVKLADRVERDEYLTLNNSAKRLGGSYSSFRGNGAIPGFQFRNREAAEAFRNLVDGDTTQAQELAAQRRDAFEDDRSQTAVERLRAMAEKLEAQAEEEENRQRKTNTAKRARYASSALAGAAADKAKAKTMRNIADAIEAGNAKFLDEVRTKTQVDMLTAIVATAKSNELRAKYPSYADQEKRRGEPPTAETADFAEFPSYASFRSDLASLARQMLEVEGTKKLGQRLMSVADDVTDTYLEFAKKNISKVSQFGRGDAMADFANKDDAERAIRRSGLTGKAIVLAVKRGQNRVILSPGEAIGRKIWEGDGDKRITLNGEFGAELVEAIGRRGNKQNSLTVPWQFQNTYDRRKALSRLGIETASEYRSAVREFIALKEQAVVNRTKELELQMVGRKADGLDFFPTPAEVADQMVEAADLSPDMAVLEPSGGMGHLADRIREAGAEPDVIELSPERRELLEEKGYNLASVTDFLELKPREFFTFGDVFRAPDGTEGVMSGSGGMGSSRVILKPLMPDGSVDSRRGTWYDRDDLVGVRHRGTESGYDRIIMNPPFSNRRDAEHVMHAYTLLKPGGRIVAIMGEGVFFGQDKKAQEFRDWLESVGGTSEKLPAGSFMDPSLPVNTSVNARMVVIDKPAGDLVLPSRDDAGTNAFRTTRAPGSTQAQLSLESVEKSVQAALRRVVDAPAVQVVRRPEDIGLVNPFTSVPKGLTFPDGSVVVFSDGAESAVDVLRTVFHELFHRGSKVRFERNADYITKMLTIAAGDETVRAEVAAWKKSEDGQDKLAEYREKGPMTGERLANYEAIAVEEALATMAERIGMGELTQPQDVIKRIARFLARVADAWGMTQLSHWLRNQSTSETEKFVMETIAMSGGKANTLSTAQLFNTSQSAGTQELADLFKALEAPRGLKLTQAYRAVDQHPLSSKIREVESNFLDILERLDDAGLVQINC